MSEGKDLSWFISVSWYNAAMTAKLSPELEQALQTHGSPCPVLGTDEQTRYVIISAEQFETWAQVFHQEPLSLNEQKALLARNGKKAG